MLREQDVDVRSWSDIKDKFNDYMDATDDAWRAYYWERPIEFITNFFYVYDTGELLTLHPSQEKPLRHALTRKENGDFKYQTIVWSWMKKSAKSTIIAAVCDWFAMCKPNGRASIKLIGNDLKQADSRVGMYMRENIKHGQKKLIGSSAPFAQSVHSARVATRIKTSGYAIYYPAGSNVEMIPIDPTGEAGGNDDLIVFSELWGWKHKAHLNMWAEMTVSPTRFGKAQQWIDTYAGYEGESPILEDLYKEIVTDGVKVDIPEHGECFENQIGTMFATWTTIHHLPWQTDEYYESERARLTEEQFQRLHLNAWVSSENAFISIDWWDKRCFDAEIPPMNQFTPLIISLDAGIHDDTFAITAVSRHPRYASIIQSDGNQSAENVLIRRYAMCWKPTEDGSVRFWSPDPNDVTPESELKRLIANYNVYQICYDPHQLEHFADRMEHETGAWFVPFGQQSEREVGDKLLYDMIRDGAIKHGGFKDDLRDHLKNANAKIIGDDRKLRIVKRDDKRKIDLAVSLAMAVKRAVELLPK